MILRVKYNSAFHYTQPILQVSSRTRASKVMIFLTAHLFSGPGEASRVARCSVLSDIGGHSVFGTLAKP